MGLDYLLIEAQQKIFFTNNKPKYKKHEFIDISEPDMGSFNVRFILRGNSTNLADKYLRFSVEDNTKEPTIVLELIHILK